MAKAQKYPKRLIEVDLPIKRISAHARREKSIRHGHISTLHIWWARRPLAACRAVTCAALWPDPADDLCPPAFRKKAVTIMTGFCKEAAGSNEIAKIASQESWDKYMQVAKGTLTLHTDDADGRIALRMLLLDFIADFAAWEASTNKVFLQTARALTQSAHEALGGAPGTRPLVVDPFAGGGAIPLEALRVGADAFASDLNPVAVLLNKVVLEYIPKYGQKLADEVRKWGQWVKEQAEKELAQFYPKDPDGATPIAYLWARTITCEGPGCGATVPLIRSLWLAKKSNKSVAVQMIPKPQEKRVDFQIIEHKKSGWIVQGTNQKVEKPRFEGTVARGSATCPCCGYTTPVQSVREQLKKRNGGANDAQLFAVVTTRQDQQGRFYRLPTEQDLNAVNAAENELKKRVKNYIRDISLVPDETLPPIGTLGFRIQRYGIEKWGDVFSSRQLLTLTSLVSTIHIIEQERLNTEVDISVLRTCMGLVVDRMADGNASLTRWQSTGQKISNVFGRQALPIVWDFCEANPFCNASRSLDSMYEWIAKVCEHECFNNQGAACQSSATHHPLPDDTVQLFFTDPPYYDAVPYADLSDFFIVWLKRTLGDTFNQLEGGVSPKSEECIVDPVRSKDKKYFEHTMYNASKEGRRLARFDGIGVIVFAHKSTSGWEAQLQAMIDAGWIFTGSWPIDTEMGSRLRAMDSAALASSVHIVCRPRPKKLKMLSKDGKILSKQGKILAVDSNVGDWREVLGELPGRIREWMVRLADEGVVGADAIFACLGPALEIFSRYSRVEKANGEQVLLREYLEQVWAAVSNEALEQVFKGANTSGFEEDARLTAMWLWTLGGMGGNSNGGSSSSDEAEDDADEAPARKGGKLAGGYVLEYDAARKIAQGLGAHLEQLGGLVEVKGDKARLIPVGERAQYLFGKQEVDIAAAKGRKKKQPGLFDNLEDFITEEGGIKINGHKVEKLSAGQTTLDRVHQAMLLFAAGRSEAVRRFLVEDGVGADGRFWTLAQALSALYPSHTEEKRWVDGILARKKGLGF